MGLDNSLAFSTDLKSAQALRLLATRLGLEWADATHLSGPAVWVSAIEASADLKLMIEEAFHFRPDLSVGFRLDPNSDDYEEGNRVMLRAVMLLLEHGRDGVLLFNGEHIVLQRIGGRLVLNADARNWTDGLQLENEILPPHEKRPLRSPLL
ncbi:SitI3 family protein [Myxococcaceae bacterium GXIMD 01537]